jgi:hypothetical protein
MTVCIKLPLHLKQMGQPDTCDHRSGWKHVIESLKTKNGIDGILVDDFVERTFQRQQEFHVWEEPWVGIFHHPPALPVWLDDTAPIQAIISSAAFQKSLPQLKGAVALSNHLESWIKNTLKVPTATIRHPTELAADKFNFDLFTADEQRLIVQVGWYSRNTRAIYQLDVPDNYQKIHLLQPKPWVLDALDRIDRYSPHKFREHIGIVELKERLDDQQYDTLLARCVVFVEYFDVSASNTVIECIARNTPLIVNRLPALVEYLGEDYPLFYEGLDQVKNFLRDDDRLMAASQWLRHLDKSWLSVNVFSNQVLTFATDVMQAAI